ncbi:hypothetical protein E2C01_093653 [Portunus trituberculatus]|uniref:Uncharacterized protein n=1 Tax=Portunus trituberculatus TaxID=210409 RepID=A0A5B7JU40_PORTR|nr:hypothetical protein [Portunus trituberculatus]
MLLLFPDLNQHNNISLPSALIHKTQSGAQCYDSRIYLGVAAAFPPLSRTSPKPLHQHLQLTPSLTCKGKKHGVVS